MVKGPKAVQPKKKSFVRRSWIWFKSLSTAQVVAVCTVLTAAVGVPVAVSTVRANDSTAEKNNADAEKARNEASAAASASAAAAFAALPPQMAAKHDGTDPMLTGCQKDAEAWKLLSFSPPGSTLPPTVLKVNGSKACSTAWVYVVNPLDGTRVDKTIERPDADDLPGKKSETTNDETHDPMVNQAIGDRGKSYTMQVYAPACVWVTFILSDLASGKILWQVNRQEVCKP